MQERNKRMKSKDLRKAFYEKIGNELELFKVKMLQEEPIYIYNNAFEIDSMINVYEILVEKGENYKDTTILRLLIVPNLLKYLYSHWFKTNSDTTLENYIDETISRFSEEKRLEVQAI